MERGRQWAHDEARDWSRENEGRFWVVLYTGGYGMTPADDSERYADEMVKIEAEYEHGKLIRK